VPADQEDLAEQSIAECPRAAPDPQRLEAIHKLTPNIEGSAATDLSGFVAGGKQVRPRVWAALRPSGLREAGARPSWSTTSQAHST